MPTSSAPLPMACAGDEQLRPVLQRAHAHAGAGMRAWTRRLRWRRRRPRAPPSVPDICNHRSGVISKRRWDKIQGLISKGHRGRLLRSFAGGPGKPETIRRMVWPPTSGGGDAEATRVAARLRAGPGQHQQRSAGFHGPRRFIIIRQWPRMGDHAFAEFLEVKAMPIRSKAGGVTCGDHKADWRANAARWRCMNW